MDPYLGLRLIMQGLNLREFSVFIETVVRAVLRLYPLRGGYRSIGMRLRRLTPKTDRRVVRLRSGPQIVVNPSDHLGRIVFWMGDSDPRITGLCSRLLRPGDEAIDIGANCGVEALSMAQAVGRTGNIVAFEPNPTVCAQLAESARLNGFSQLEVRCGAVTDRNGFVHFDFGKHTAVGRVRESGTRVAAFHARDVFEEIPKLRLVKIDAEGHEGVILSTALESIRRSPPDIIIFESLAGALFWNRPEVMVLASLGYSVGQISRSLWRLRVSILDECNSPVAGFDFVAWQPCVAEELRWLTRA